MDISETLAPKSEQLNAEDMLSAPRTVTIESVTKGSVEQPVNIHLVEFPGRPFRPCKTVRRILVSAWGPDAATYVGRRMTLFCDPKVRFGGQDVGGIRVSHLSHIDKRITVALTVTRGKRALFVVEPLPGAISQEDAAEFERRIADAATIHELDAVGRDLKAQELGGYRKHLQSKWSERHSAINGAVVKPVTTKPNGENL